MAGELPSESRRSGLRTIMERNLFLAAAAACIGPISFGFTIGYSSPALPEMKSTGVLSDESATWFASLLNIAALVGGPVGGVLIEKIGRKKTVMTTNIPFFLGWLCIYFASGTTVWLMYLGRILTGAAVAMITVASPVYIAEISTRNVRGMLGSSFQLAITIGIFLAYALGTVTSWNTLAIVGATFPILGFAAMFYVPETPRWLVMNSKKKEALSALNWLRGLGDNDDELRDIEESLSPSEKFSWSEFRRSELYQPLVVSVGLMVFQQLSGINAVMFYAVSIFESAGFKGSAANTPTIVLGAVQVIVTVGACFLMDRLGRRQLLLFGGASMGVSLFAFSLYYYRLDEASGVSNNGWMATVCLVAYIVAFSLGWGPIPTLVMSEVFPVRARGAASSIAVCSSWLSSFFITKFFLSFQQSMGSASTFCMFGSFCIIGLFFVMRYVPETKGKTLEDIELFFLGRGLRKDAYSRLPSAI